MVILNIIFLLLGNIVNGYTVFPAGKCPPQNCEVFNPYILKPNASSLLDDKLCFTVEPRICDSQNFCCNDLKIVFEKLAFKTFPECFYSIEKVTINGIKKGGGVYITNYTGFTELKVTAIRWTINQALYSTFCIHLRRPCETIQKFCRGDECTYSVYNPFTHECCPTCNFVWLNSLISPNILFSPINPFILSPYIPNSPINQYSPHMPNMPNNPDIPNMPNIPNNPDIPNMPNNLDIPNMPNMPNNLDMPNMPYNLDIPNMPNMPNMPNRPKIPNTPNTQDKSLVKLVIKTPTLNQDIVLNDLCPKLASTFNTPCSVQYISSSGTYYGHYLVYDFNDILYILQAGIDNFTKDNDLLCDSTITLVGDRRTARYRASYNTCILL